MAAYGLSIVIIDLHAHLVERSTPIHAKCHAEYRPWLHSRYSCAVLEIDCFEHGITGLKHEIEQSLVSVNAWSVGSLVISHCPQLQISPRFQQLTEIAVLEFFNSTIDAWPSYNALTATTHHRLLYIFFLHATFKNGTLPSGLLSNDFPDTIVQIVFCSTNVTKWPHELHQIWKFPIDGISLERKVC